MYYAQLQNSIVIGVSQLSDAISSPDLIEIASLDTSLLGSTYADGVFTAPAPEPTPAPRHISVGAFFDRFGSLKWAILADTNPGVQALIKDCSVRKYIDLDNADLPAGLSMLVSAGHAIDTTAILTATITEAERP